MKGIEGLLPAGKLPHSLLGELLAGLPHDDPRLLVGPTVGEDAAVIDFAPGSERLLVAKSDPITFATDQIGYYAVNVCVNDLAVSGATPLFYFPTLLLPAGQADAQLAAAIFGQIGAACRQMGIVVAGGHSEITPAVTQPVVAGSLLGEVARERMVSSAGCRPGDVVLLAGAVPVEGASLIAREKRTTLLEIGWPAATIDEAAGYLYAPGISVLRPSLLAADAGLVTAMHDPTEGGVATGLLELALAGGVGIEIELDAIPVLPLARDLCVVFGLDPLGVIASGALLATAAPANVERLLELWGNAGWQGTVIGRILPQAGAYRALRSGHSAPFPTFAVDEITKLWQ
jgi:hydrogenase expression/formation protein HypE